MEEVSLSGAEVECVRRLGKLFEEGHSHCKGDDFDTLGLTNDNYVPVLSTMEHLGAIKNVCHTSGGHFRSFSITAVAVILARQIEKQESKRAEAPDLVQQTIDQFRRHPIMSRIIFWGIALGAFLVIVSNAITIGEKIYGLFK